MLFLVPNQDRFAIKQSWFTVSCPSDFRQIDMDKHLSDSPQSSYYIMFLAYSFRFKCMISFKGLNMCLPSPAGFCVFSR